jgi:uncharacterized protein (TIGR02996 family)
MPSTQAFLDAILEQPDADAPRLIYADWLEEQGDPRAELIRLQCERANLRATDSRCAFLEFREAEVMAEHLERWLEPVRRLGLTGRFRRGFLEITVSHARTLLEHADRLFTVPWVLHVNLRDAAITFTELQELAASPWFARMQRLDFSRSGIGNEGMACLAASPHRCRPTQLLLKHVQISTTGVRLLTEGMDLSRLTELRLYGNQIGVAGGRALAACANLRRLRILDLAYNQLGTVGGEYLAESHFLNHLHTLDVRGNSIGPRGKKALRRRFGPRVFLGSAESLL